MTEQTDQNSESPTEKLASICYQFINLYEYWSADRKDIAAEVKRAAELINKFKKQIDQFDALGDKLHKETTRHIESAVVRAVDIIRKDLHAEAFKTIEPVAQRLLVCLNEAERVLKNQQSYFHKKQTQTIVAVIFSTVLVSLAIVWLLIPRPTLPLTQDQIKEINIGYQIEKKWPSLSAHEKNQLKRLINDDDSSTDSSDTQN